MNGASAGRLDWNILVFAGVVTAGALIVAGVIAILTVVAGTMLRRSRDPLECLEEEDE